MTVADVKALFARWENTTEHDAYNNMADVLRVLLEEPELLGKVNLGELLVGHRPPYTLPSKGHARPLACLLACARAGLPARPRSLARRATVPPLAPLFSPDSRPAPAQALLEALENDGKVRSPDTVRQQMSKDYSDGSSARQMAAKAR